MISIVGKAGLVVVQYKCIVLVFHTSWLVAADPGPGGAFHRHNLNRALLVAADLRSLSPPWASLTHGHGQPNLAVVLPILCALLDW